MISYIRGLFTKKLPENTIKRIWYDEYEGRIYIHVVARSGMWYMPNDGKYSYWLASWDRSKNLPKGETIYILMDVRDKAPGKD